MIYRSDLAVCYAERKVGGAYNAIRYAEKRNIPFINFLIKTC